MTAITLLLAVPALAAGDSGEFSDPGNNFLASEALYWAITFGFFVVLAALVAGPQLLRRPRYRPGRPWPHDPLWFAGPEDPEGALAAARPLRGLGGASAEW